MKTKPVHFAIFEEACHEWIAKFGLSNWRVYIKHENIRKSAYAETHTKLSGYVATIFFNKTWDKDIRPLNNEEIRKCAQHEIVHVLLARIVGIAGTRFVTSDELGEAEEEAINRITDNL